MRILVVEDNLTLASGIERLLKQSGYAVDCVHDGLSAEAVVSTEAFDVVILDLNLPELDGLSVLRSIRDRKLDSAVLILTAKDAPADRIRGLDLGADDYLTKPFDVGELEARVRALIRRKSGARSPLVSFGALTFDLNARTLTSEQGIVDVPARELSVLELLFSRSGKVVHKHVIIESLSAFDDDLTPNAVEQYVSRLRRKLIPYDVTINTARGIGYYLSKASA
ncbi:two-component system, OmpR family, response regulator [Devosia lucknowensis]|uniref:Two-component system, OmpR family, response regulator n=1 Tax=Devosia lucknowensis TaxID=1096929 RepID=A0A1Y6F2E8_9HYPH|nr:response regulator transcription factor [Devosia lucknowensis]SMQ68656.1 two-component system, OmpR family, response regulator [Devosia lucknowensis]